MLARYILPIGAAMLTLLFALGAFVWSMAIFFSYGLPPCEEVGALLATSRLFLPLVLIIAAFWLRRAGSKRSWLDFAAAVAVASLAIGVTLLAYHLDADKQKRCSKRTWSEAAKACQANPKYYRPSVSKYGTPVYTLIAPGTIDEAWQCLMNWNTHNGSVGIDINEGVYEAYRHTHRTN